jgi:protein-S-isoprenylcysteine O-methyltransferase Ste14
MAEIGCPVRSGIREHSSRPRSLAMMLYGCAAYVLFLVTFLYAIGFVGDLGVPKSIDSGPPVPLTAGALLVNLGLLTLFAVQHSVMARPAFKRAWTKVVPEPIERATYVLCASLVLLLLFWQWRQLTSPVWTIESTVGIVAVWAVFWVGWALVLVSTFLIDHFELFGLRQVFTHLAGRTVPVPVFKTPFLYRLVRHPLYLGFLLAFWATHAMTLGHLLFAAATTGYILIAIQLEERDLVALFGERYRVYRRQVAMLLPLPGRKAIDPAAASP